MNELTAEAAEKRRGLLPTPQRQEQTAKDARDAKAAKDCSRSDGPLLNDIE